MFMLRNVLMSIRSSMCRLTEEAAPSTNVPSLTEWLTLLWKVKVGHMTLHKHHADETCIEKVISCVWRCQCDQQQVLPDLHLSLTLSDPFWNPSLVSPQKSTHRYPGDVLAISDTSDIPFSPLTAKSPLFIPQGSPITAGTCWSFVGAEGTLAVLLSHPVKITHVTVDHLPRYNSPTGDIRSAPKDLEVYVSAKRCWKPSSLTPDQLWCLVIGNNLPYYGCDLLPQGMTTQAGEGTFLGRFRYDKFGEPTQSFSLPVSFKPAKLRLTYVFVITDLLLSGATRIPLRWCMRSWNYASSPTGVRKNTPVFIASVSMDRQMSPESPSRF